MGQLTASQLKAISIMERSCSVVSLLGSVCIIVTFSISDAFHNKPINRLVFYASFGNMMSNVATLISRAYLDDLDSFGCQFQAMLTQWFMAADTGWILAMAINVYLTFYQNFSARRLRRLEFLYLLACYGISFIPAFVYLFVRHHGKRVYGDATLWCSISTDFEALRFATFYIPIWLMILLTIGIYIRAGGTILRNRRQLRQFNLHMNGFSVNGDEATTSIRANVKETANANVSGSSLGPVTGQDAACGTSSVTASTFKQEVPSVATAGIANSLTAYNTSTCEPSITGELPLSRSQNTTCQNSAPRRNYECKSAAWSYAKCALLYFTAILITWIPSTANRVYSLSHDLEVSAPLAFLTAFVLPLQGFWNWVIYSVMSWSAYKDLWKDLKRWQKFVLRSETINMSGQPALGVLGSM